MTLFQVPRNESTWRLNLWQGDFPRTDAGLDGHVGLSPADAYEPSAIGVLEIWQSHSNQMLFTFESDRTRVIIRWSSGSNPIAIWWPSGGHQIIKLGRRVRDARQRVGVDLDPLSKVVGPAGAVPHTNAPAYTRHHHCTRLHAPPPPHMPARATAHTPFSRREVLRGGSYLDSSDGSFNHMVTISTRMGNTADSSADNVGFRCAMASGSGPKARM